MKNKFSSTITMIIIFCAFSVLLLPVYAGTIPADLTKNDLFVKKGFSIDWINQIPSDKSWIKVPAVKTGKRSIRIKDLNIDNTDRNFLSFKNYGNQTYTYVTGFTLKKSDIQTGHLPGLYLAQIGINWEIYLNGNLIKKEIHLDENGKIITSKNTRDLVVYILPEYLNDGNNILAFKIIGDPAYQETGFYWEGRFYIDDYETLVKRNSEITALILMFIYLFIGLYHLYLFSQRRTEKYNLVYGIFSILIFIYLLSRSHTIYSIIPDTALITRIELISLFMILPMAAYFFDLILNAGMKKIIGVYAAFCSVIIIPTFFAPLPTLIDILLIWQISALIFMPFTIFMISSSLLNEIRIMKSEKKLSAFSSVITGLFSTVPGNLVIGAVVAVLCGIFDILDAIYFYTGIALLKYGFLFFVTGITLILAKRFQNLFTEVEDLNINLKNKINDLNTANKTIALSEEKYRVLVEGSEDIIFSLDENWKLQTANKAISNILKIQPSEIRGLNFYDLLWESAEADSVSKHLIQEKISKFSNDRIPVEFKIDFKTHLAGEPIELNLKLEYINIEGKNEILGKASNVTEDNLMKYIVSEKQHYVIGNYFITADEISYRMTRSAVKFSDQKTVTVLRVALREIIINAIEHGNLNITFQEKSASMIDDNYFELLRERQMNSNYKNKTVDIKYKINDEKVIYQIIDEGSGFDFKPVLNGETASIVNNEMLAHGRGISMAKNVFDKIIYRNNGTCIILVKYFKKS